MTEINKEQTSHLQQRLKMKLMKMLTLYLSFLFLRTVQADQAYVPDKIFYWETKPFISLNNVNGTLKIDGILPTIYDSLGTLCLPVSTSVQLANYTLIHGNFSEQSFYKMLEETNDSEFISGHNRIWFPLFINFNESMLIAKNLKYDNIINSPKVGVIVHKNQLTLLNKFFQATLLSYPIAAIFGGFIMLFSTILWLAECFTNKDFSKSFINGFGTSLWCSIITMTTVGYGDITPKSLIGRFISIIWIIIGTLMISGLTGMFTSTIENNSFLTIQNKEVAAFNNSIDFVIARKSFNSRLKAYHSYHDVLQAVDNQSVEYGIVNIDILLYMNFKENYQNVALVKTIDTNTPAFIVYGNKTNLYGRSNDKDFENCKQQRMKDIKIYAQDIYEKLPIIDTDTPQKLWETIITSRMTYPGIVTLCVLFSFLIKDVIQFAYKKKCCKDVSPTVFLNNIKGEEKASTENDVLFEELTRIEEHIAKLKAMYKK